MSQFFATLIIGGDLSALKKSCVKTEKLESVKSKSGRKSQIEGNAYTAGIIYKNAGFEVSEFEKIFHKAQV